MDETLTDVDLLAMARERYPILNSHEIAYKFNPKPNSGFLEFWPADEPGTAERPRPVEFPLGKIGLEVYDPKTTPDDVMADFTSHFLIDNDPVVGQTYRDFLMSMNAWQQNKLKEQYKYAQKNHGEERPFEQWAEMSGEPGWLRGYAFNQWSPEFTQKAYTPQQREMLDKMMNYLRKPK